jgi:chorismate mutase/prephenate dehydrogenase
MENDNPVNDELGRIRNELASIDREILKLAAKRRDLVEKVGTLKEASGSPTRDFSQERVVLERALAVATEYSLSPRVAESLMQLLIGHALTTQEQLRIRRSDTGSGKSVLVIGGGGRMGRWLVDFLATQGFRVEIADPDGPVEGFTWYDDWQGAPLTHDFIVVAAPLRPTANILRELAERKPGGVVFDIGSLKSPLTEPLRNLVASGVRTTSIHPMFGPDTEMLSGKHVISIDVGDTDSTREVEALFASTMADVVGMSLEDHDRVIALVLGLSHALNIAFFTALARSGEQADRLTRLASTTFAEQLKVASKVAAENPHLYFEIQYLNAFGSDILDLLRHVVIDLEQVIDSGNEPGFTDLMEAGRRYLALPSDS